MDNKTILALLFCSDPHNAMYRIGLALSMEKDDIVMFPLNQLHMHGEEEEEELSYAYTRSQLIDPDFTPACCTFGMVSEFNGKPVLGCIYAWVERLAEISSGLF